MVTEGVLHSTANCTGSVYVCVKFWHYTKYISRLLND